MDFNTVTAAELIEILKSCSDITNTPLDELYVVFTDDERYSYGFNEHETLHTVDGMVVSLES